MKDRFWPWVPRVGAGRPPPDCIRRRRIRRLFLIALQILLLSHYGNICRGPTAIIRRQFSILSTSWTSTFTTRPAVRPIMSKCVGCNEKEASRLECPNCKKYVYLKSMRPPAQLASSAHPIGWALRARTSATRTASRRAVSRCLVVIRALS